MAKKLQTTIVIPWTAFVNERSKKIIINTKVPNTAYFLSPVKNPIFDSSQRLFAVHISVGYSTPVTHFTYIHKVKDM